MKHLFALALLSASVFAPPAAHALNIQLLPLQHYLRLTGTEREAYIKSARKALVEFDRDTAPGYFADLSLFSEADATSFSTCVVGGVVRPLVNGKCPTTGRECNGANSFRCGKIYGEVCVTREPLSGLSARCDTQGHTDIGGDSYSRIAPILEKGLSDSCSSGPRARGAGCRDLQQKMTELNQQYKKDTPHQDTHPQPTPPQPDPVNPGKDEGKLSKDKSGACKKDRNQGQYGTCHAFCLTCVYDNAMAKANGNAKFKSSANWIAMLSVVERMCDDPGSMNVMSDQLLDKGWYPNQNLANLSKIGACAEENFIAYQPNGDWAASLRSRDSAAYEKMSSTNGDRGQNGRPEYLLDGNSPKPSFDENEKNSWRQKFGIGPEDAYDLFCPKFGQSMSDGLEDYAARLEKMKGEGKLDPKFVKCAEEALNNKEKLGTPSSSCSIKNLANSDRTVDDLKNMLKNSSGPIPMVITTSVDGHSSHCVTLTGYDDTGFNLVNSWGSNQSYTHISYAEAPGKMIWTVDPSCPFIGGAQSADNGGERGASSIQGSGTKTSR